MASVISLTSSKAKGLAEISEKQEKKKIEKQSFQNQNSMMNQTEVKHYLLFFKVKIKELYLFEFRL